VGTSSFTITSTDAAGATVSTPVYSITINAAPSSVSPSSLPAGDVGSSYDETLTTTGGTSPYAYAVTSGALPPGLTLSSGVLSGTPTTAGTYNFTITSTDAAGSTIASPSYSLAIAQANSSLSGYVYDDANDSGQRKVSSSVYKMGIPDVAITLERTDATATEQTVLTQSDGSFEFGSLPAGTYTLIEAQPPQYLSGGKDTAGSLGGTGSTSDTITQIVLGAGQNGSEYDFGEWLLAPGFLSKRLALASTPTTQEGIDQLLDPPPTVELGGGATNYAASYTSGVSAVNSVAIASPSATVSDTSGELASLTVTISNRIDGGSESLTIPGQTIGATAQPLTNFPKISAAYAGGVLTLSGADSVGDYQSVLRSVTWQDAAASPNTSPRYVTVVAADAISSSSVATTTVTDPPAPSSATRASESAVSESPAASVATSVASWSRAMAVDQVIARMYPLRGR
jgi:hypothetical protein